MATADFTDTASARTGDRGGRRRGTTTIADNVVATIAGIAAREAEGIYALGGTASRALGSVRSKVSRSSDPSRGVKVDVGEKQAAIDLDVIVEYGEPIEDAAREIDTRVADAVETMTGLEVVEINIKVLDVHLSGSDEDDDDADGTRGERVP